MSLEPRTDQGRLRRFEYVGGDTEAEIGTSVLKRTYEQVATVGEISKATVTIGSHRKGAGLYLGLWPVSQIEHYVWGDDSKHKQIAYEKWQEYIDDAYLRQELILPTNYTATKYGYDYIDSNGKINPGKTRYNVKIKKLLLGTGGQYDYLTEHLLTHGVQHLDR